MGIARLLKPSRLINLGLVLVPIQKVFVVVVARHFLISDLCVL